jgi:hypothetical protein
MSYGIMGGSRNSHMLTYQTTRPIKCIYFDGESATLFGTGQLDTQMLHIFGNVSGPPSSGSGFRGLWPEYARAIGLCDWLEEKGLGGPGRYEGVVRMNAGFEMIWCNFSSPSLRLISHLNVTAPLLPPVEEEKEVEVEVAGKATETSYYPLPPLPTKTDKATDPSDPPAPPNWRWDGRREPFLQTQSWNWFKSGVSHYGSSAAGPGLGETRVRILGCGFLNYYAEKFGSQALVRGEVERKELNLTREGIWMGPGKNGTRDGGLIHLMRRRRAHTLGDVSREDATVMRNDSERVLHDLLSTTPNCSGMDWTVVTNEIVQVYAGPLFSFMKTLEKSKNLGATNETVVKKWAASVRDQTHAFLIPFLEYPEENEEDIYTRDSTLFRDTYARCRFHHTRLLDPAFIILDPEEELLKWAVEETTSAICNVIVDIGLSVEGIWQSHFNVPSNSTSPTKDDLKKIGREGRRWKEGTEELMAWLGWASEWTQCEEKCAWDEMCFIPMWPLIPMRGFPRGGRRPRYPYYGPGYGEPGHGGPGYEFPSPPYEGPPGNGTGRERGPPGGWFNDEKDLWTPRCVKDDYFSRDPDSNTPRLNIKDLEPLG